MIVLHRRRSGDNNGCRGILIGIALGLAAFAIFIAFGLYLWGTG